MKRIFILTLAMLSLMTACQQSLDDTQTKPVVVLPEGPVVLGDTELGMYYGDVNYDGVGVFSIVLSDARCYQDDLDKPYMDSEGDMLVLRLKTPLVAVDAALEIPDGAYPVVKENAVIGNVDASGSYLTRFVGNTQSKWALESGTINIARDGSLYKIETDDLVVSKAEAVDTVAYVFHSELKISDYMLAAPGLVSPDDDIVDMPFTDVDCVYYGDLYGNGTGNFLVTMSTKGLMEDTTGGLPGIYICLNFFSRLYSGNSAPVIEEGRYTVSSFSGTELFQRWTIMPGVMMDSSPFGSYLLHQIGQGEGVQEFISTGYVDVKHEDSVTIISYNLKTGSRSITGTWRGSLPVEDLGTGSTESFLTTLDHDVECDLSKVESGTLVMIETLHRKNVEEEWDYDIAEAWQLYLQPRDWTDEEYDIPWNQDENENGVRDRLEAYCADGDFMIFEFVLPLGSQGDIAPVQGETYTYTFHPDLSLDDPDYELFVSRMGRPYDEIFDPKYAAQYPGWAETLGIESYDRCLARRGFTWSTDGWRGNWYQHYEIGQHYHLDEYAPAVNGWVKVTRTALDVYDFEWDFTDDNPGTPNKITGKIEGVRVNVQWNE